MRVKVRRTLALLAGVLMVLAMPMGVAQANDTSINLGARSNITVDPLDFQACFEVELGGFSTSFQAVLTAHGETTTTGSTTLITYDREIFGFGTGFTICATGGDPNHTLGSLVATVTARGVNGVLTNSRITCHRVAPSPMVCTI